MKVFSLFSYFLFFKKIFEIFLSQEAYLTIFSFNFAIEKKLNKLNKFLYIKPHRNICFNNETMHESKTLLNIGLFLFGWESAFI